MNTLSIVIADDHPVVRSGLRQLFEGEEGLAVSGEAGDGHEAVSVTESQKPSVLLLDWMLPGLTGLDVLERITATCPKTKVLVFSMHAEESYVLAALRGGATGYALKSSGSDDLVEAIRTVAQGQRYLSPPLTERAIETYIEKSSGEPDAYEKLTQREREVLQLTAEGRTNHDIAEELYISPRTVETHRANIMRKLHLRGQTELIRFALQRGIIPLQPS